MVFHHIHLKQRFFLSLCIVLAGKCSDMQIGLESCYHHRQHKLLHLSRFSISEFGPFQVSPLAEMLRFQCHMALPSAQFLPRQLAVKQWYGLCATRTCMMICHRFVSNVWLSKHETCWRKMSRQSGGGPPNPNPKPTGGGGYPWGGEGTGDRESCDIYMRPPFNLRYHLPASKTC